MSVAKLISVSSTTHQRQQSREIVTLTFASTCHYYCKKR